MTAASFCKELIESTQLRFRVRETESKSVSRGAPHRLADTCLMK